jgi:hypothetical protein
MNKQKYIKPEVNIVFIKSSMTLLAGSEKPTTTSVPINQTPSDSEQRSRDTGDDTNFWDE